MTLWCHNLNYKTKRMEDIAQSIGKNLNYVYILLCDIRAGVGS